MIIPTFDAATFATDAGVIEFPAPKSNPHMALPVGNEVLVPDLVSNTFIHTRQS
jgi:hypothetical protein